MIDEERTARYVRQSQHLMVVPYSPAARTSGGDFAAPGTRTCGIPGEFEPHRALLLAGGQLAKRFPDVLGDVAGATGQRIGLLLLASGAQQRDAASRVMIAHGLPPQAIRFVEASTDSVWIRDYGPIFVSRGDGVRTILDAPYETNQRTIDDRVPRVAAGHFHLPVHSLPILLDGGNLLSNGRGLCVTTTNVIGQNYPRGYDIPKLRELMREQLGMDQTVFIEPLRGENTGHVDVFACFTSPDTVVIGEYSDSLDPENSRVLDRNAARLDGLPVAGGKLRVVRVPMPSNADGVFRSYTNVIFANGVLVAPSFPGLDPEGAPRAIAVFRRLLPGWNVVCVDARRLVAQGGGLRCVCTHVPAWVDL